MMEQIILGALNRHGKENYVICSIQQGFTQGKSCLINLTMFYDEITVLGS